MLASRLRTGRAAIMATALFASIVISACGTDSATAVDSLDGAAFQERTNRICTAQAEALDEVFDTSGVMTAEIDEDIEPELERVRRQLLVLWRDLLADLRRIQPVGRETQWGRALDAYEAAIERAGEGARVDVYARGLEESVTRLIDDFALDECF